MFGFYVSNICPSNGNHTAVMVPHDSTRIHGGSNWANAFVFLYFCICIYLFIGLLCNSIWKANFQVSFTKLRVYITSLSFPYFLIWYIYKLRYCCAFSGHQRVNNIIGRLGFDVVLNVTRRPKYLKRKIVAPVLLLSSLTVISYILPVETGERVGFSMTALLTMMLTIQYTMDQLPEMEEEPPVLYYGRLNLFFMITSLLITSIVLNLHHKKRRPMPRVLRRVVSFACRLLWLRDAIHANDVVDLTSNDKGEDNRDWLSAGRVLDRLSFVCFFFITFFILFEIVSFGF